MTLDKLEDLYDKGVWFYNYDYGYDYARLLLGNQWEGQWFTPDTYLSY